MSAEKWEVDISEIRLRRTVDTKSGNKEFRMSPVFRLKSGGWKLGYYKWEKVGVRCYVLGLHKCSGVFRTGSDPFHVSVHVERSEDGRMMVDVLAQDARFTPQFEEEVPRVTQVTLTGGVRWYTIWRKEEEEILRSLPEFRLHGILRLIVVLKEGEDSPGKLFNSVPSVRTPSYVSRLSDDFSKLLVQGPNPDVQFPIPNRWKVHQGSWCYRLGPMSDSTSTLFSSAASVQTTSYVHCLEGLSEDLSKLLDEGPNPDVEFQCGGKSTKAHSNVVSARSQVIAKMLAADMVEGRTKIVKIPDMGADVFQKFLQYLYNGKLDGPTFGVALNLFEAGDQYAVTGLAKRCSEYLMEHLSVENACEVLVIADAHSDEGLVEKVVDYMVDERFPVACEDWPAFCGQHPMLANKVLNRGWKVLLK